MLIIMFGIIFIMSMPSIIWGIISFMRFSLSSVLIPAKNFSIMLSIMACFSSSLILPIMNAIILSIIVSIIV